MTIKINTFDRESTFDRVAREQFDTFEGQERRIRSEERASRAAQLKLPMQLSTRLRKHKAESQLQKGRRP